MNARRALVGIFSLAIATTLLAGGGTAAPESEQAAGPASPAPSRAPVAAPTVLTTPRGEPTGLPTGPVARPSSSAFTFPFALPTGAQTQSYAFFARGAQHESGVIDLLRKDEDLYLDLRPENFGKPYIILPSIAAGVGGSAFAGRVFEPLVVVFKRVGKRILWITPNTRYVSDPSAAASLAISVADSVIQSSAIVAEDTEKQHTVIAPAIFLSDFEGIGADLGRGVTPPSLPGLLILSVRPSFSVDATKSYYLRTKAFPRNDEITVNLTFNGPANALPTVPDGRGVPIVMHYSVVAPPEKDPGYVPRYADDRIGYFITARKRLGTEASTPFERYIERWNLARGPIVFTLTKEIPAQYRETVRRGILGWNAAFAKIGYPHAIEVRDVPTDATFDPDDARYNSVRWISSDSPDFVAYSPHVSDPDTGEIIRAQVVIDGESIRSIRRGYNDRVVPIARDRRALFAPPVARDLNERSNEGEQPIDAQTCDEVDSSVDQAAVGLSMLAAKPGFTEAQRERYTQSWLYSTVLHEVGHTLGLRHNFRGSTAFTYAQLHDPAFTAVHGTTASVMDYTPANLAAASERQADFFPNRVGVYDEWAIAYGYTRFAVKTSDAEAPFLRTIASRSTEPGLAYGTDEDASGGAALDPRIQRFDLSSDPLRFVNEQFRINDEVTQRLMRGYRGDARSYQDLRQTFVTVLSNERNAMRMAAQYIGGIYTSRNHRSQRPGELPFASVPRVDQRRAFAEIDRHVLSSQAFRYAPDLLNAMEPDRYGIHWGSNGVRRSDFPIREVVGQIQDDAISAMFAPSVLARISDQSLKAKPGATMDLADLFNWTNAAIFDDLGAKRIDPLHRDLQRRFADLEVEIAFLPSIALDQLALPRDLQSLARYQLRKLRGRIDGAERGATDVATKAHLDDLRSRLDGALRPQSVRPL